MMETLTIEIKNPKARRLIDDLVDLGIISLKDSEPTRVELWDRVHKQLPQPEPDITEEEIMEEIRTYRMEADPNDEMSSPEASQRLQEAHRIIDAGGGIENAEKFLAEFEQSRQDRSLPFRD